MISLMNLTVDIAIERRLGYVEVMISGVTDRGKGGEPPPLAS